MFNCARACIYECGSVFLRVCVYVQLTGGVGGGRLSPDTSCSVFWRDSGPPKRKE